MYPTLIDRGHQKTVFFRTTGLGMWGPTQLCILRLNVEGISSTKSDCPAKLLSTHSINVFLFKEINASQENQ